MPRGVKKEVEEVKVEEVVQEEVAATAEEVAIAAPEPIEAPVAEPVPEVVETVEEKPKKAAKKEEPKKDEVEEKEEEKAEARQAAEAAKPVSAQKAPVASPVSDSEWKFVEHLRIYSKPGNLAAYFTYTGNVKVLEKVGDLTRVAYMKNGFGVVEGLTDEF